MTFVIFMPEKKGHYEDYSSFLISVLGDHNVNIVRSFNEKIKIIVKPNRNVIFLNIDHKDIYWSLIRCFFTKNSFGVSVSIDSLLNKKSNSSFFNKGFMSLVKARMKYQLFKILKSSNRLKLISIHKMTNYEEQLKDITSLITYDFQYYDLPYLNIVCQQPKELLNQVRLDPQSKSVLIFNNTSKTKKNLSDLSNWISISNKYRFFIIGDSSFLKNNKRDNTLIINRYVSNAEMLYFMKNVDIVYCYYNNDKPSGFMGRAMQLGKKVIVPYNSYLGSIPYDNSIRVTDLKEMEELEFDEANNGDLISGSLSQFDDSELLRKFLLQEY